MTELLSKQAMRIDSGAVERSEVGMTREIQLTKGLVALVDDADYEWLSQWQWAAQVHPITRYATRQEGGRIIYMHREILKPPPELHVDHADQNGLNNQRGNLRACTAFQNMANRNAHRDGTSGFLGVSRMKPRYPWEVATPFEARVGAHRKQHVVGYFATAEGAAYERDRAALFFHGEFASLNFPNRMDEYLADPYIPRDRLKRMVARSAQ